MKKRHPLYRLFHDFLCMMFAPELKEEEELEPRAVYFALAIIGIIVFLILLDNFGLFLLN